MPNHHCHENCDFHADNTDTGPSEPGGNLTLNFTNWFNGKVSKSAKI